MLRRTFLGILAAIPFWRTAKAEPTGTTSYEYGLVPCGPCEQIRNPIQVRDGVYIQCINFDPPIEVSPELEAYFDEQRRKGVRKIYAFRDCS